ncbi:GlxA family transcriptional regulator [Duganella sp. CF458]|uniref:GlxA family transcriptional regulator n=1 Tax=Duganella sp. CF458 TaxID=1884368 RepID=UPI001113FE3E|nr:helix-turn-helix domain-containing protein [Duganella sp. CF458]
MTQLTLIIANKYYEFARMSKPRRVVMVAFPPAQMLDITGPLDALAAANSALAELGKSPAYEVFLAAPGGGAVATTSGISINATVDLFQPGLEADIVIIAGGPGARAMINHPGHVEAMRNLCQRSGRVASICTGAFALASTGVLNHSRATTHWAHFEEFEEAFPAIDLERDALYLSDGKYHTSAGVSAGIDYTLALIQHDLGKQLALSAARALVVFLKRPGGQSQFSAHLAAEVRAEDPDRFGDLSRWMEANLADDISVTMMADKMAMSPRNFARRFKQAMNVTPATHLQMLRVDAARRLLSESSLSAARIAKRCGFASTSAMRADFLTHVHVTPEEFRSRFQSAGRKFLEMIQVPAMVDEAGEQASP